MWTMQETFRWTVDLRPFVGHTASVEDIQWSPNEDNVCTFCVIVVLILTRDGIHNYVNIIVVFFLWPSGICIVFG